MDVFGLPLEENTNLPIIRTLLFKNKSGNSNSTCKITGYCCNSVEMISVSAKVKWELYKSERRSKSVGLSTHNDSFRAKNVANKCLHWGK